MEAAASFTGFNLTGRLGGVATYFLRAGGVVKWQGLTEAAGMSDQKTFISADDLLALSFKLAAHIFESGFRPTYIVGVWRGGAPVGIAVQEYLAWKRVETDHIALRTSAYTGIDQMAREVRVHGESYLVDALNADDRLLIVDDVFDSGSSIEAIIDVLRAKCRRNFPQETKIATVYFKPERNRSSMTPDFYVEETDAWLVFPHELCGLSPDEIRAKGKVGRSLLDD
jgi:uncharacterized protein